MKILVVDDSQFVQKYMSKLLKEQFPNSELFLAGLGEEAYKIYQQEKPDYIITDLLMPGIDGKMLIKLIRH
ncbi:MAG: chemotaxis-specific methylesterase [Firmicutes bacterium ADurb.Bin193]|nr:MAG: chemotaxis-specific methylesterase [Firmicutes bacterium ADurb.Bin193]